MQRLWSITHKINPLERFLDKVEIQTNGCWYWIAYLNKDGYGTFRDSNNKKILAHRFSYELYKTKIPDGLQIDHLCRNRRCKTCRKIQSQLRYLFKKSMEIE